MKPVIGFFLGIAFTCNGSNYLAYSVKEVLRFVDISQEQSLQSDVNRSVLTANKSKEQALGALFNLRSQISKNALSVDSVTIPVN